MKDQGIKRKNKHSKQRFKASKAGGELFAPVLSPGKESAESIMQKQVYLSNKKKKPAWFFPLVASLVILVLILFLLPRLFAPSEEVSPEELIGPSQDYSLENLAPGDHLIIGTGECPLYNEPAHKSLRISTALYGEELEVLDLSGSWVKVQMQSDGFIAWCERDLLSNDLAAVDSAKAVGKVLVYSPFKRVMSHTVNGYMLFRAPMGSTLFYDYTSDSVLRLRLANNQKAWISNSGLRFLEANENLGVPDNAAALFASSAMNFHRSPNIPGGMSKEGADMAGVIHIAAKINGLDVSRDIEKQAEVGEEVITIRDSSTGLIRVNLLETGDIIFFYDDQDSKKITRAAIILEEGQALTVLVNDSVLSLRDLNREEDILSRVAVVRRYFP